MRLIDKCFRVIYLCETQEQFKTAVRYVNLAARSKDVQSDSYRVGKFFIPLERAMAVQQYKINNNLFLTNKD